jgi:hypothetical protein
MYVGPLFRGVRQFLRFVIALYCELYMTTWKMKYMCKISVTFEDTPLPVFIFYII